MTKSSTCSKLSAADVQEALSEFQERPGTIAHLVVSSNLLHQSPEQARLIVAQLPGLDEVHQDERKDLWKALLSPTAGVPQDPKKANNHRLAIRSFVSSLQKAEGGSWAAQLSQLILDNDDTAQYGRVMAALTSDQDRLRLAERLMTSLFTGAIANPESNLPSCQALLDELDPEWAKVAETRDAWRWAWRQSAMRCNFEETETASSILEVLEALGVDINEPGGDDLSLLDSHLANYPTDHKHVGLLVITMLLDHGAEWKNALSLTLQPEVRSVIENHPAVRRHRLEEVVNSSELDTDSFIVTPVKPKL